MYWSSMKINIILLRFISYVVFHPASKFHLISFCSHSASKSQVSSTNKWALENEAILHHFIFRKRLLFFGGLSALNQQGEQTQRNKSDAAEYKHSYILCQKFISRRREKEKDAHGAFKPRRAGSRLWIRLPFKHKGLLDILCTALAADPCRISPSCMWDRLTCWHLQTHPAVREDIL